MVAVLPQFLHLHWLPLEWFVLYIALAWCVRAVMVPVILRRDLAPGAAIAWLGIIFLHPYIGLLLYLVVGETRLGPGRAARHRELVQKFRPAAAHDFGASSHKSTIPDLDPSYRAMVLQAEKISGLPIVSGNGAEFIVDSGVMIDRLIADIGAAKSTVHLLYFIFACDETGGRVAAALESACARGVRCRLLVDAVGSRHFLHRQGLSRRLMDAGVEVAAALPVAPLTRGLPRMDLRNHRKLAIIDGSIVFVGSQNIINADYGRTKVGPWFDFSAHCAGPVAAGGVCI